MHTFVAMEIKKTWGEKLMDMSKDECLPMGDSPKESIYSAVFQNKKALKGKKFRPQLDEATGKWFVCRIK